MAIQFSHFLKATTAKFTLGVLTLALLTACTPTDKNEPQAEKSASTPATTTAISSPSTTGKKPIIYTSTNMWGAIAKAVGGDNIDVVNAIDSPNQDPHDYQASAKDKLAMQNASMVLVNGGGYDDWAMSVAHSLTSKPTVINAFELSGFDKGENHDAHEHDKDPRQAGHGEHEHQHSEVKEHVFYSLATVKKVATAIANQLATSDPAKKAIYLQNAQAFDDKIVCLKSKAKGIATNKNPTAVATESVSDYLLADMGIKNITPPAYVAQSETEAGVSAKVLQDTKNTFASKMSPILVVNAQTEDATAKQLIESAKNAKAAIVEVSETLTAVESQYIPFMNQTINKFNTAVNGTAAKPLAECN